MEEDKGKKIFETLVLTVIVFCIGLIFGRSIAPVNDISKKVDMNLFWEVWDTLDKNYVEKDKVEDIDKVYGAIKGLVQSYNDPATIFLTPEETEEFNNLNSGKYFEGIGAELGYSDGSVIIVAPIDGSPAKEAGIRPGDLTCVVI